MTPRTPPPPPADSKAQIERFQEFLAWLLPLSIGFSALATLAFGLTGDPGAGWVGAITLGYTAIVLAARRRAREGALADAVTLICGGLLVADVLGLAVQPALLPTLQAMPLLVVAVALTYGRPAHLRALMIACWLVAVAVTLAADRLMGIRLPAFTAIYRVASMAAVLGLVLLLLWQFSRRLTDTLGEAEGANASLRHALAEVQAAEEKIKDLAYRDALTGLPNRLVFTDRLSHALTRAQREGNRLAVLFLDLDRFKLINDSLGHGVGDLLLQAVASRLTACLRGGDTVARLGGDEFTLLLPDVQGPADAARVAEKILVALRQPFTVEGRDLYVTASMGISLYPDDGADAETLVRNADAAMYRAKEQGRDAQQLYSPLMNERALERLALENGLRRAVGRQELVLHYQPLIEIAGGRIAAVEALVRWDHPERGLLWPSDFMPLAEAAGLVVPMSPWVLRHACAQLRKWHEQGLRDLRVSVNLSARQFQSPELVGQVRAALSETGLDGRFLDLEVTENDALRSAESTIARFRDLKALGVRICIDDFGIGYSSLGSLRRLPIDALKVDRSFVRDITTDPDDAAIVRAVIAMAHSLKLQVVAEGVETEEQLAFLRQHRCDLMQGYLSGPPAPAEECGEGLVRQRVAPARARR